MIAGSDLILFSESRCYRVSPPVLHSRQLDFQFRFVTIYYACGLAWNSLRVSTMHNQFDIYCSIRQGQSSFQRVAREVVKLLSTHCFILDLGRKGRMMSGYLM